MDKRIKILVISAAVLIIGSIAFGVIANKEQGASQSQGIPELTVKKRRFDFGTISMADGLVKHTFELKNTGSADLKISSIKTSCMCTEAVLEVGGKRSPKFGMHTSSVFWAEKIKPGQTANLEVIFDPNAHGPNATGPVTRTVTLLSNSRGKSNTRTNLIFTANVVR